MQVKKFEAKTMKEALEMVKSQMGPDAIILSAKDNTNSFGLGGQGSVEITAAVSEQKMQKRKFVESRLKEEDLHSFVSSPAKTQKEIIEKMVSKHIQRTTQQNTPTVAKRPLTSQRYIEIDEAPSTGDPSLHSGDPGLAQQRIRDAAKRAWSEFNSTNEFSSPPASLKEKRGPSFVQKMTDLMTPSHNSEVVNLRSEIENLRQIVTQFQVMPQNLSKSQFPGSEFGIAYEMSYVFEQLTGEGIFPELAARFLGEVQKLIPPIKFKNKSLIDGWVAKLLLDEIKIAPSPTAGKMHLFVGPSGSGKTSALVKLACNLVVRESKRIALISTDTIKIGAAEQLKIYSQILNVPFALIRNQSDWNGLIQNMSQFDNILVDFPGLSMRRPEDLQTYKNILPPSGYETKNHLVLSVTESSDSLMECGQRFSLLNYNDVIFTGLDEVSKFGNILNFSESFNVPIHSFSLGPKIPEDYECATKERVLDLILKVTQSLQQKEKAV